MEILPGQIAPQGIIDAVPGVSAQVGAPVEASLPQPLTEGMPDGVSGATVVTETLPAPTESIIDTVPGASERATAVEPAVTEAPLGSYANPNVVPFVSGTVVNTLNKAANTVIGGPAGNLDAIRAAAADAATPAELTAVGEASLNTK